MLPRITVAASVAALSLSFTSPASAGADDWRCFPGIKAPVRIVAGNVECASMNGRDCIWDGCPGTNASPTPWASKGALSPLACGADHKAKYGSAGYEVADHWCKAACEASPQCSAAWRCMPGIKTPIRLWDGNIQCAAGNGRDCLWDSCPGTNKEPTLWAGTKGPLDPLVCGADHKAKYGSAGYEVADHWCLKGCQSVQGCTLPSQPPPAKLDPKTVVRVAGGECPQGQAHVSLADAEANRAAICAKLGTWDIARLAGGGSMDGGGYKCQTRASDDRQLGHSLCAPAR
jgi:hypothetical protein